jgi:hypothetical protein
MFAFSDEEGFSWVVLDAPVSEDFASRLLNELLAIARPFGASALEAQRTRKIPLNDVIADAIMQSRHAIWGGRPGKDVQYIFQYVAGCRIKVRFLPGGLPDGHTREHLKPYDGLPVMESRDFDVMYGHQAMANAARLALL